MRDTLRRVNDEPAFVWRPGPRPGWVRALNEVGDPRWIALDESALLTEALRRTGKTDFGDASFREPLRVFLGALEREAKLHYVGRTLARADAVEWLANRLRIVDLCKQVPAIERARVAAPLFVTGLPRTGTSILHELLAQDPAQRAPLAWEVKAPCPPPDAESSASDARIEPAERAVRLWCDVVPEYDAMHELGARQPVECIALMAPSFRSDELAGRHVVPSYAAWLAQADMRPAYAWHARTLQVLQWRHAPERWVLKAPSHLASLDALFAVYPDARIVHTHRDPLPVMASVASILFATAWVRSDAVDPQAVLGWFTGETCQRLLANAMRVRDAGRERQFADVLYADLVRDPIAAIARVYDRFALPFTAEAEARMRAYLAAKPKGRHGAHRYAFAHTGFDRAAERARFADYQRRYGVPSEDGA
ncbi:MAG: sulfotransferase [Proteobacteria bacterium]|nr:MAG: sulfotransferase [Pseudomonadota bacterium]